MFYSYFKHTLFHSLKYVSYSFCKLIEKYFDNLKTNIPIIFEEEKRIRKWVFEKFGLRPLNIFTVIIVIG